MGIHSSIPQIFIEHLCVSDIVLGAGDEAMNIQFLLLLPHQVTVEVTWDGVYKISLATWKPYANRKFKEIQPSPASGHDESKVSLNKKGKHLKGYVTGNTLAPKISPLQA